VLTRGGVARKLGKSVATVRRLEGHELWPVVDTNGVHRFSEDQVSCLQHKLREGVGAPAARGEWLKSRTGRHRSQETSPMNGAHEVARDYLASLLETP
jgi:hypothetical protein